MMDEPLATGPGPDRTANPGYARLTPLQNTALLRAATLSVARARAQIGVRGPGEPLTSIDLSTIALRALEPLRDVCVTLPPESAQLIGVLVGQVILVECLRGDLAGVRESARAAQVSPLPDPASERP